MDTRFLDPEIFEQSKTNKEKLESIKKSLIQSFAQDILNWKVYNPVVDTQFQGWRSGTVTGINDRLTDDNDFLIKVVFNERQIGTISFRSDTQYFRFFRSLENAKKVRDEIKATAKGKAIPYKIEQLADESLAFKDETYLKIIKDYKFAFNNLWKAFDYFREKVLPARIAAQKEQELASKETAKEAERAAKVEERQRKKLQSFDLKMTDLKQKFSSADDFYFLGVLAKHTAYIRGALPSSLMSNPAFLTKYKFMQDPDIDRFITRIPANKKTVAGNAMKYGLSLTLALKDITCNGKKTINNTDYIANLIFNYNFKLSNKQDYDKILSAIPANYVSDFEDGYYNFDDDNITKIFPEVSSDDKKE